MSQKNLFSVDSTTNDAEGNEHSDLLFQMKGEIFAYLLPTP